MSIDYTQARDLAHKALAEYFCPPHENLEIIEFLNKILSGEKPAYITNINYLKLFFLQQHYGNQYWQNVISQFHNLWVKSNQGVTKFLNQRFGSEDTNSIITALLRWYSFIPRDSERSNNSSTSNQSFKFNFPGTMVTQTETVDLISYFHPKRLASVFEPLYNKPINQISFQNPRQMGQNPLYLIRNTPQFNQNQMTPPENQTYTIKRFGDDTPSFQNTFQHPHNISRLGEKPFYNQNNPKFLLGTSKPMSQQYIIGQPQKQHFLPYPHRNNITTPEHLHNSQFQFQLPMSMSIPHQSFVSGPKTPHPFPYNRSQPSSIPKEQSNFPPNSLIDNVIGSLSVSGPYISADTRRKEQDIDAILRYPLSRFLWSLPDIGIPPPPMIHDRFHPTNTQTNDHFSQLNSYTHHIQSRDPNFLLPSFSQKYDLVNTYIFHSLRLVPPVSIEFSNLDSGSPPQKSPVSKLCLQHSIIPSMSNTVQIQLTIYIDNIPNITESSFVSLPPLNVYINIPPKLHISESPPNPGFDHSKSSRPSLVPHFDRFDSTELQKMFQDSQFNLSFQFEPFDTQQNQINTIHLTNILSILQKFNFNHSDANSLDFFLQQSKVYQEFAQNNNKFSLNTQNSSFPEQTKKVLPKFHSPENLSAINVNIPLKSSSGYKRKKRTRESSLSPEIKPKYTRKFESFESSSINIASKYQYSQSYRLAHICISYLEYAASLLSTGA